MLSIVIPVFNEQDSLEELLARIDQIAQQHQYDLEVLLIDDGSSDNSWSEIERLAQKHNWLRGIRLRRNFGKAAALAAGFERVRGTRVITMDADLQDDPREIPNLLAKLESGFDVVSGWKKIPSRSMAQSASQSRLQCHDQPPNRRSTTRSQLRP